MDSSSEEDIVKKKGWALVNKKGSIENSSDEEQLENVAVSKRSPDLPLCQDIDTKSEEVEVEKAAYSQSLAPLSFQLPPPESPTLQTPGSNSSSGSTLVSSLPSPLPHLKRDLPINKVEEDLSSVADILKSKVEKEDSQSVDSFEILSEPASGDCEPSLDGQSEDGDDEDFAPLPSQNIPHRLTSDSESDFVRLTAPSEMDSAHSGLEEIPPGPSQSSKSVSSSPEPALPIGSRPVNAPYQDMRGVSSEEESDHVRIMSRRWPTEDGGFLLVQRFKKLEPDDISTVSSSISDFSSFSMMGNSGRQRLNSDTQEEAGESDTEGEASNSSYASEEPLPVNMMVQNVPPAVRQYLHKRNEVFNSKLTIFAVLVLTAGLTLGIGHFVGSSQMVSHHQSVQEGQKLRLRSLQDELVSCMDRRKEIARLYQEKEKEVHSCAMEKEELVKEMSSPEDGDSSLMRDKEPQELRLCSGCSDGGLRYSKFCNTRCPADLIDGHSWVAMDMRSSIEQEYWVHDGSDGLGMKADQVTYSQSMPRMVHEVDCKIPSQASMTGSFVNFVAKQAPSVSTLGEVVLPGESSCLIEGLKGGPLHSAPVSEESEELLVHSSLLNEESEEVSAHSGPLDEIEVLPTDFTSISDESEELPSCFSPQNEEREVISVQSSPLTEAIQDVPGHSVSLEEGDEVTVPAHLVSRSKSHERVKTESQKEESSESMSGNAVIDTLMKDSLLHPINHDDTLVEEELVAMDNSRIGNIPKVQEYDLHGDVSLLDGGSADTVSLDIENVKWVQTTARSVKEDLLETNDLKDTTLDPDATWVCVDDAEPEHCHNWIPKAELKNLVKSKEREVREEVEHDTGDESNEKQLQHLDELETLSVDGHMGEVLEMNEGEKLDEESPENSEGDNKEERQEDALTKDEREALEGMEETSEGKDGWIWMGNDKWTSVDSEGNIQDPILDSSNSEESTDENRNEEEDHLDIITQALQSAWGIVENASKDIIGKNVSLKDASDIVKERVKDLKEVVEGAWDSVQTAASQINEDHIQPMVKKMNKFVKRRWSEAGTRRTCRGKNCKGGRRNNYHRHGNVIGKRARKTDLQQSAGSGGKHGRRNNNIGKNAKNLNIKHQPATIKSRNVEEQENKKGRNMKPKRPTRVKTEAKVLPKKANKKGGQQSEPKQAEVKKHMTPATDPGKPSEKFLGTIDNIRTKEIKREYSSSKKTQEAVGKGNIPESGKMVAKSPPPVLNIEKVLDSMDMSCGGEVRCVENHKIDAARLLKEMISYRQWLWEQRFRKDVDEVEDFMEELEEFIDEEDVDDEDIEDLKDEFEDMVEDIQKTTKKFFRKQERQTRQKASNSGGSSFMESVKGKQSGQRLQKESKDKAKPKKGVEKQKKKEEMKKRKTAEEGGKDVDSNKPSSKGTSTAQTVHTVTFNPQELPSVQMQNSSQQTMSTSDVENEQKDEGVPLEAVVMSPGRGEADKVFHEKKQMGGGYVNTDEWFFRRAQNRQRRRKENPDASWYFERFHSWEEERKNSGKNDWYFQRGKNREESRDCPTQPWHCEWAHDESVVTLWEMYKWLTERFTFRADLRAWELEDQINWFLKKP
ncbi:hypothetical protein HOLleu_28448 [Holothuria leucospilota]|uniref:Uncharacterized protein n=1 Tax=Holothuria leucospilota TaxID=206669 RepID=A0A9Q1BMA0_HOLLE|nr:hypothetical protein HOLleu_28448 [Holothuria leucospilota]